jgi:hypothetical protein
MGTQSIGIQSNPGLDTTRFKQLYQNFDAHTVDKLSQVYSPNIVFKDPIHQLEGIESLSRYFANFCKPETDCHFEFINELVASDQAFFQWRMHYSHPKLNSGEKLVLSGCTLIKFGSQITYHEDFYDMGAMIYRHIPVIGWAVKKINNHLKEQ